MNRINSKAKLMIFSLMLATCYASTAQVTSADCEQIIYQAVSLIKGNETIIKDETRGFNLLLPCADAGNAEAQFIIGSLYKSGLGIIKDENKAFQYIKKAALQDHLYATCELGVLYKDGIGCELNFDKAIQWFEKAEALGNSKGSYSIGYMYFKGLGSVEQNYRKAIEWFQKSNYPMAKHWLGICNYFGYGIPVNKDRALELWLDNPISNSKVILEHTQNYPNLLSLGNTKAGSLKATDFGADQINQTITAENQAISGITTQKAEVTKEQLTGEWQGKLIELDWANKRINRTFPATMSFGKSKLVNGVGYQVTINESTSKSELGILLDNSLYLDEATMALPRLYQDDRNKYNLDYDLLSFNTLEVKEINNIRYLIANVETKVKDWNEPGAPMLLVLGNTKALTDNGQEIDESLIEELTKLKDDSFIKLYPNPFKSDLLIQYELGEESTTSVEIYDFAGQFPQTIVSDTPQAVGKYLYHFDGSNLPNGLYVVRVKANDVVYTKLIIKE